MDKKLSNYIILNPWRSEKPIYLDHNSHTIWINNVWKITLNTWQSEIFHPFGTQRPDIMDKQHPNYIILNPWRSEIVHPFGTQQPGNLYGQTTPKQNYFEPLTWRNTPSFLSWTQEYGQTTPKLHCSEPLMVRNSPSIWPIVLNPWRSEIPIFFVLNPRIWTNNAQTTLFWILDSQK